MEDSRIIDLYWERDQQAIVETGKKYGRLCRGIAFNLLFNEESAEECVNDVFLGAWNAMPEARPQHLPAFLLKITRNLAMKRLTYENAAKRVGETVPLSELGECVSGRDGPDGELDAKELTAALERFLLAQDAESRNIFLRRYWFFDSVKAIAAMSGASESKVKSALLRLRRRLKTYLQQEGFEA